MTTKNQEQHNTAKNSSQGSRQSQGNNAKTGNSYSGSKSSDVQPDKTGSRSSQKLGAMNEKGRDEK